MPYNHLDIEQKWQKFWEENQVFRTVTPLGRGDKGGSVSETENPQSATKQADSSLQKGALQKPKKYILDMFPYPSGAGLHVGHPKGYTATDIVSRYYHAKGYNVLHTMGWDAFGLPAENYAIKTGTHPAVTTAENIRTFIGQMKSLGFSYDWSREIDTTDPEYYQWTQWIFLELFKKGLAYEQDLPINYCPSCKTGLANEEVLADNTCDRCGTRVERRALRQWVLKITEYADRLIDDLDGLDWPEGVKEMQRNWIGKSEGCEFRMEKDEGFRYTRATSEDFTKILEIRKETGFHTIDFSQEQFFVAKKNGEIAGFIRTQKYGDITELGALYVGENFRGDKLGYKLISYAIEHTDASEFYMDCKKELRGYYERFGFTILDTAKPFQLDKFQKVWNFYGKDYTEQEILDITLFMTIKKDSTFPKLPSIEVYTTRIDTVYGMTYAVLAPDHPRVYDFITDEQSAECEAYITEAASRSDQDRTNEGKEKTGVFTGSYVVNPFNGESVPLWIADYVLGHYGTGAVMAVPAHDERDFAFAKRYSLPVKQSIAPLCQYEGLNKPHQGEVFTKRDTVDIIMENDKGEILLLKEERGVHFPGGGLDGDEEIIGARREFTEETGYLNFSIKKLNTILYRAFSLKRQQNLEGYSHFYNGNLLDNSRIESEVEQGVHEMIWVKKEDVLGELTWANHILAWRQFLNPSAFYDDGILVNSGGFDGLTSAEARRVLSEKAESEGFGRKKVNYKLRDWLFSRQRYWGEPIPLIHLAIEDLKKLPHITDISQATDTSLAYILKRDPLPGESCDRVSCKCGHIRELIIDGKVYSKIYDGINSKIVIDSSLPLTLPEVEKYEPAGDGQSPLAGVPSFVNVKLADNLNGKRETNTMPQWGGSCWYYLRYMDPHNPHALASKEALEYWGMVDEYVGGAEHAVLHLLYARFWHKALYDIGVVPTKEPFQKLTNVGMILAYAYERSDGGLVAVDLVEEVPAPLGRGDKGGSVSETKNPQSLRDSSFTKGSSGTIFVEISTGKEVKQVVAKMSKSLKNVINPNDIVREYGADTLRLYEMSMGAFTDTAPWNPEAIIGVRRFLDKAYTTFVENSAQKTMHAEESNDAPLRRGEVGAERKQGGSVSENENPQSRKLDGPLSKGDYNIAKDDMKAMKLLHKTVKKVGEDIVEYKFNTAISALQILLNEGIPSDPEFAHEWKEKFAIILHPFAPHMAEELWSRLPGEGEMSVGQRGSVSEKTEQTPLNPPFSGGSESIYNAPWPSYDDFMLVDDEVTIAVQVGGKLRGTFTFLNGVAQEEVSEVVRADEGIKKWLEGKEIVKEIFIPNKMLSIVLRDK